MIPINIRKKLFNISYYKILLINQVTRINVLLLLLFMLINSSLYGQKSATYNNPSYSVKTPATPELTKIDVNENYTILYFSFKTAQKICIPNTFFLRSSNGGFRSEFKKAEKISICTDKQQNTVKEFVLYFDKLGEYTKTFDFCDPKITGKTFLNWGITGIDLSKKREVVMEGNKPDEDTPKTKTTESKEVQETVIDLHDKMINILNNDTLQSVNTQYELIDSTLRLLKSIGYEKIPDVNYNLISEKKDELKKIIDKKEKTTNDTATLYLNMMIIKQELFKGLTTTLDDLKKQPRNSDNIYKIGSVQNIIIMMTREMSQLKNELLRLNNTIEKQNMTIKQKNTYLIGLFLVLLFVAAIAFILFKRNNEKQKINQILTENNAIITKQKTEISDQYNQIIVKNDQLEKNHRNITDSIQVAKRIQDALFPAEIEVEHLFPESFIFYRPRNIVSGDFYWMKQFKNKVVIAIADCTGHGVPGAFMSMLGISLLNELVNGIDIYNAAEILNRMRAKVKSTLKQTGAMHEGKEGMDMALCMIDVETLHCDFAGANNPLFVIRNGEMIEYEADSQPIAIYIQEKEFTNKSIELQKDDQLYMFSDGFVDQFGGTSKKKYQIRKFKQFLLHIEKRSFSEKKFLLEKEFEEWQGANRQVDDVLVFGMKI